MIRQLNLVRFGKFVDTVIDFGPVTVITGENEAGKTTIFDALMDTLCSPSGNTIEGRELKGRYGEEREARPDFEGAKFTFDTDEFRNLYALRSGDIHLEISDKFAWMERVKARLFSGGIDPQIIREKLDKQASSKGSLKHNKDLRRLEKQKEEIEGNHQELLQRRQAFLSREQEIEDLRAKGVSLKNSISKRRQSAHEYKEIISREEKISKREQMTSHLVFLTEGERLRSELESLAVFKENRIEELDSIQRDSRTFQEKKNNVGNDRRRKETDISNKKREKLTLSGRMEKTRRISDNADDILQRISEFQESPPMRNEVNWNMGLIVVAAIISIAGILGSVFISSLPIRVALGAVGVAGGSILLFLSRKVSSVLDIEKRGRFLGQLLDKWRNSGLPYDRVDHQTIEGFQEWLIKRRADLGVLQADIERLAGELNELESNLEADISLEIAIERKLDDSRRKEKEWLQNHHCGNRDEYIRSTTRHIQIFEQVEVWNDGLSKKLADENCGNADDLRSRCDSVLRSLDNEGLPAKGMPKSEIAAIKRESEKNNTEIQSLNDRWREATAQLENTRGLRDGSLGDIPQQILNAERDMHNFARQISENHLDRNAAFLAAGIFEEIGRASEAGFEELGNDIGKWVKEIIQDSREITVPKLDTGSISMTDAGGTDRSLDTLSGGTRDSFMLAARLAMALKAREGQGLLILDDPFLSFDPHRRRNAMRMLEKFQDETDWQLIFLLKDPLLLADIKGVFSAEKLIELRLAV